MLLFSLELQLPRDAASVPVARGLLASSLEALGVDDTIQIDIELMLTEACTNVIRHAEAGDAYTVQTMITSTHCVIRVLDAGKGFDAEGAERERATETGPAREHGRGLMIMKSLADDIRFRVLPREGALVSMEKELRFKADALGPKLAGMESATELFDLARAGQTEQLLTHVEAGVPVDLPNDRGDTFLMLAAYHGHADTVRALAARGADPERANERGQRPLAGAVFKQQAGVVRALLDVGADPAAGEPSAVDTARMFGHTEFLDWFGEAP
ncbi:ATP-binding protein [Spirillospora sp. NPDC048911]|uniref:ATP-binding protein n=1 Tax=Spirillospora sp. NPDC048911 TaxID=3364527 RepID=UPI0037119F01